MTGYFTLQETERAVSERLGGLPLDFEANRAISNLHRAAAAARHHMEQSVLRDVDLSWTAFVVLWVVWIWEEIETRHVAEECGISKGTLTGVATTLEKRGLLSRATPAKDRRLSVLSLTPRGRELMVNLFPRFNEEETYLASAMSGRRVGELTRGLREITNHLDDARDRQEMVRRNIQATDIPDLANRRRAADSAAG